MFNSFHNSSRTTAIVRSRCTRQKRMAGVSCPCSSWGRKSWHRNASNNVLVHPSKTISYADSLLNRQCFEPSFAYSESITRVVNNTRMVYGCSNHGTEALPKHVIVHFYHGHRCDKSPPLGQCLEGNRDCPSGS